MKLWPDAARDFPVVLQRNAFTPRLVARAGDVWRAMQDVVVDESTAVGWPPERYQQTRTMFVVRSMVVKHAREVKINEPMTGRTFVSRARREILFTREVRLSGSTDLIATATQEWAYLSHDLTPTKPGPELYDAFRIHPGFTQIELPDAEVLAGGPAHQFEFTTWHTWMDPFGHINHPDYVDFCDEAWARILVSKGLEPQNLVPDAEAVYFRAPISANAVVLVESKLKGYTGGIAVVDHRIVVEGKLVATATTHRHLLGDTGTQLIDALK